MNGEIVRRRGGWYVTGESWSGPWASEEAAECAKAGDWHGAHTKHAEAIRKAGK